MNSALELKNSVLVAGFDTETTGLDKVEDHIVQLAAAVYREEGEKPSEFWYFNELANPGRCIPAGASAVHGITDDKVSGAPASLDVARTWWSDLQGLAKTESAELVLVAHNSAFDLGMLAKYFSAPWPECKVIDTLRLSRRLAPDAANHRLTTMITYFGGSVESFGAAHDALADTKMALHLLGIFCKLTGRSVIDMANWLTEPTVLPCVPFGRHKGKPFWTLPTADLRWFLSLSDACPDITLSAQRALQSQLA